MTITVRNIYRNGTIPKEQTELSKKPFAVMGGLDSLLSTVQMPKGVPVATMSIGKAGAINAAILCAEILSLNDNGILDKLTSFKNNGCKL